MINYRVTRFKLNTKFYLCLLSWKFKNKKFSSFCECFIDNKLSIHFGDDKTKTIFSLERKAHSS